MIPEITTTERDVLNSISPETAFQIKQLQSTNLADRKSEIVAMKPMCIIDFVHAIQTGFLSLENADRGTHPRGCTEVQANPESPFFDPTSDIYRVCLGTRDKLGNLYAYLTRDADVDSATFSDAIDVLAENAEREANIAGLHRNFWLRYSHLIQARILKRVHQDDSFHIIERHKDVEYLLEDAVSTLKPADVLPEQITTLRSSRFASAEIFAPLLRKRAISRKNRELIYNILLMRKGICVAFNERLLRNPNYEIEPQAGYRLDSEAETFDIYSRINTIDVATILGFELLGGEFEDEIFEQIQKISSTASVDSSEFCQQ